MAAAATSFEWNSLASSVASDFTGPGHTAALENRRYATLAEYAKATGQDPNSVLVDYVFVKVPKLDAQSPMVSADERLISERSSAMRQHQRTGPYPR